MVHKRYVKRGNKLYGPYLYKSIRDNEGKVINIYLGPFKKKKGHAAVLATALFLILAILIFSSLGAKELSLDINEGAFESKSLQNNLYDISIKLEKNSIEIKGIEGKESIRARFYNTHSQILNTKAFALEDNITLNSASITLEKQGPVKRVYYCREFSLELGTCEQWLPTEIPFSDNGDTITFTVTHFTAYAAGENSNLTIYDDTDSAARYSFGTTNSKTEANYRVLFFSNYSNATIGGLINGTCSTRFNITGTYTDWVNMTKNDTSKLYEYNRTFDRKGNFTFQVNCINTTQDTLNATDYFFITNTPPAKVQSLYNPPQQSCNEDTPCTYNSSVNFTDDDINDQPLADFTVTTTSIIFENCLSIGPSTGILTVNCTNSSLAGGPYNATITVRDSDAASVTIDLRYTISAVNDRPTFASGTSTLSCTQGTLCTRNIGASDEEDGSDAALGNLTFTDNSTLFEITNRTGEISFTPTNGQVGTHYINISVNDTQNSNSTFILEVTIQNTCDAPNITYACDNELRQTEDTPFQCSINISDVDEGDNITLSANYTWFVINRSAISITNQNTSGFVNFTPNDTAVYSHYINISATDGCSSLIDSVIINLTVNNTEDTPYFINMIPVNASANALFSYVINATDDDMLSTLGDTINYTDNSTLFQVNLSTGVISFTPTNAQNGTHYINITVADLTNRINGTALNLTIFINYPPIFNGSFNYSLTEGNSFYVNLSLNTTDADGDLFNFTDNTTLFAINATSGEVNFTPTDSQVGTHWVLIQATDTKGAYNNYTFNFTVFNENDPPFFVFVQNITIARGTEYLSNITANDTDLLIPGATENLTFADNTTFFNITKVNATAAEIRFTSTLNGSHYASINVTDNSGLFAQYELFINITNGTLPPAILYACDNETSAVEDTQHTCIINASDSDEGDILTFESNTSFFLVNTSNITTVSNLASINATFTPNYTVVGNWSINITVVDRYGNRASYIIQNFNVASLNDNPNLTDITNQTITINATFSIDINATDEEDGNESAGLLRFEDNTTLLSINSSTGLIELTASNVSLVGNHTVNITVYDSTNKSDSQIVIFAVRENQPPSCSGFTAEGSPFFLPAYHNATENSTTPHFVATCSDGEGDTVSYHWYWNGTLNKTGTGTGANLFNYTPSFREGGLPNITLVINDSQSSNLNQYTWNISVYDLNAPPFLTQNIPNLTWDQDSAKSINLSAYFEEVDNENLTYFFYTKSIDEPLTLRTNESINFSWLESYGEWHITNYSGDTIYKQANTTTEAVNLYRNITTFYNLTEVTAKVNLQTLGSAGFCLSVQNSHCNTSQAIYFNATDNKTYYQARNASSTLFSNASSTFNITLNSSYWLRAKVNGNNTLVYISSNGITFNLTYNSTHPLLYQGGFALYTSNAEAVFDDILIKDSNIINITISVSESNATFTPATGHTGESKIYAQAFDGNHTRDSNQFSLIVEAVTTTTETITVTQTISTGGGGGLSTQQKIASLDIIVPALITLNPLTTTIIPVILNNSGEVELNILDLLALTNASELRLALSQNNFTLLKIGERVGADLSITAGLLSPDRYTIDINANVKTPAMQENAQIVVDVREKDAALVTQLREQVQFTRDLFLQNPECLELSELIEQAELALKNRQLLEGLELIHKANEACKDFIAKEKEKKVVELQKKNFLLQNWKLLALETLGIIILMLLIAYYLKRQSYR
ncbi:hypothetical protein HY501_02950 [Candidatus Woesearchaeota archaeon]|nr:hypothetical protein [Candidatus Woesearchaeota archaeon]